MSLLSTQAAHREYAERPKDERFASLQDLIAAGLDDKNRSAEKTYNLKDLRAVAVIAEQGHDAGPAPDQYRAVNNTIVMESPKGAAKFTHWSFGQLARTIQAPAAYLRTLTPSTAATCINEGIQATPAGTSVNVLVRMPNGDPTPTIRACTSESYGRLWDCTLYDAIQRALPAEKGWMLPPTWGGEPAGANRGDRDSFLVYVNGGSIVSDPSITSTTLTNSRADSNGMYRGILVRNSEVGAASVTIERILFRYICGNHLLWGAVMDKQYRRRHFGHNVLRDTVREIQDLAWKWTRAGASDDERIIRALIDHEIATTKEGVIDELRKLGASKEDAERAYDLCEQKESVSPRSWWGAAQGLTRASQETDFNDTRYLLDKIAGLTLAKGAKLVYA